MRHFVWIFLTAFVLSFFGVLPQGTQAATQMTISAPMPDISEWQSPARAYLQSLTGGQRISWETYRDLQKEARRASAQSDWPQTVVVLERAIGYSPTSSSYEYCQNWANLTLALMQQSGPSDKTMTAAYNVVDPQPYNNNRRSCNNPQQAVALGILAQGYAKRGQTDTAVALYKRSLLLQEDPEFREQVGKLAQLPLEVEYAGEVDTGGDQSRVCFGLSAPLLDDRSVVYDDYVGVDPAAAVAVFPEGKRICIEGLEYSKRYTVTLRQGMPAAGNSKMMKDTPIVVDVPSMESRLSFRGNGYILPRVGVSALPMVATNVDVAEMHVLRINDRSLVSEIRENGLRATLYGYRLQELAQQRGEWVWSGDMEINAPTNKRTTVALPLDDILKDPEPGIYAAIAIAHTGLDEVPGDAKKRLETSKRTLFRIMDASLDSTPSNRNNDCDDCDGSEYYDYDDYYTDRPVQWFMVSDIGLSAYQGTDGMMIAARSFASGKPIGNLDVRLYARNNKELARATTDGNGLIRLPPGLFRGVQGGNTPFMVMAFGDNDDFSVLELNRPAFDLTDRGVGGREAPGALDAYLYTDRGIYRPGETVHLSALLRDGDANAVTSVPLTLALYRPDGVLAREFVQHPNAAGGLSFEIPFDNEAETGSWSVSAMIGRKVLNEVRFSIEDFVPDRIKVTVTDGGENETGRKVDVEARYLYDAPAVNAQVDAVVTILKDTKPFKNYERFKFGVANESFEVVRTEYDMDVSTDEEGKASFSVSTQNPPDSTYPMTMRVMVSVSEDGGRAVSESLLLPLRPKDFYIGLRGKVDDWREVPEDANVEFEIVAVDASGNPVSGQNLNYTLYRESWRYQWMRTGSGLWKYDYRTFERRVEGGQLRTESDKVQTLSLPVRWGTYRLEVTDASGRIASSMSFNTGWGVSVNSTDTPDMLKIDSDRTAYAPGEKAKIALSAPFEGEVLLTVLNDRVLYTDTFPLPADGRVVEVPVTEEWGVGAYVTATVYRPGDSNESRMPGRAVGLTWVGVDPAPRTLNVVMDLPNEIEPRQTLSLPITVEGATGEGEAFVTLALVDEGILQITDFATPDPLRHYFGKRRLAVDLRDSYGNLIDPSYDHLGVLRSGGDIDSARNKNISETVVKPLALFSGVVKLDADGKTTLSFDIPDFNGQVRLMAVAYTKTRIGKGEARLLVRDPMVVQASLPRFLAPGDVADMTIMLNNLSAPDGRWKIALSASGALAAEDGEASFDLAPGKQTTHYAKLKGVEAGVGHIVLDITAPDGTSRQSTWSMSVRPLQLEMVDRLSGQLKPGDSVTLLPSMMDEMVGGTGNLTYSASAFPNMDVVGLLQSLSRYPYGCLEQTTSGAMPLLYMNEVALLSGNPQEGFDKVRSSVQRAIERILSMQTSEGGFGMWSRSSYAEDWGSVYAMDFLTRAHAKGYEIPGGALERGLSYIRKVVNIGEGNPYYLGTTAYGLYVLGTAGEVDAGSLRYFADNRAQNLGDPASKAMLAAALNKVGDKERAMKFFEAARSQTNQNYRNWSGVLPYGSWLRDQAMIVALGIEAGADRDTIMAMAERMADTMSKRKSFSTQEQAWLLMAANGMYSQNNVMTLEINGLAFDNNGRPINLSYRQNTLREPVVITNVGDNVLRTSLTVAGSPIAPQPAESAGYSIKRSIFTTEGKPVDLSRIRQTDQVVVVIDGKVEAQGQRRETMVIDYLPAGLEVENSRISDTGSLEGLNWLKDITPADHTEIRDDRFVTVYRLQQGDTFRAAYIARAVTPGTYGLPPAYVEDMYAPEVRGRGSVDTLIIRPRSRR